MHASLSSEVYSSVTKGREELVRLRQLVSEQATALSEAKEDIKRLSTLIRRLRLRTHTQTKAQ